MTLDTLVLSIKTYWLIVAPVFLTGWIIVGWGLMRLVFLWIHKLTQKTESQIDDILLAAAQKPILLIMTAAGVGMCFRYLIPSGLQQNLSPFVPLALKVISMGAGILFIDNLFIGFLSVTSEKHEFLKISRGLVGGCIHTIVFGIGALVILDSIGISVTPIVASLGIGSLAVALALQPTLENLFSGVQIIIDQPVKPGQFIKLESGEEGYVERVGWRSTWIRQIPNNMIIIPNSQLVKSRILNYHYPTKDLAVMVEAGVHYASDLEKVERVTRSVAEHILKTVTGGVPDFTPLVWFHTLGSSGVNFTVVLGAREFSDGFLVKHEFIKALTVRYAKEGIVMPYPIIALNTDQEKAVLPSKN